MRTLTAVDLYLLGAHDEGMRGEPGGGLLRVQSLTLTVIASVTVVPLIGAIPVISVEFGRRASVLPLFRPTILAAALVALTLSVAAVDGLIEGANDFIEALRGGRIRSWHCGYQHDGAKTAKTS